MAEEQKSNWRDSLPPLSEDQSRYLTSLRAGGSEDADSWEKAFNMVNVTPDELKDTAWGIVDRTTKGAVRKRKFDMHNKWEQELANNNESYFPENDPFFSDENYKDPVAPESLFPSIEEIDQIEKDTGYRPDSFRLTLSRWAHMASIAKAKAKGGDASTEAPEDLSEAALTISEKGTKGLQAESKLVRQQDATRVVQDLIQKGEQDTNLLSQAIQYAQQNRDEEDQYALEKEYIDSVFAMKERNPEWQHLKVMNPTLAEELQKRSRNQAIAESVVEQISAGMNNGNWMYEFVDGASDLVQAILGSTVKGHISAVGLDTQEFQYIGNEILNMDSDKVADAVYALAERYKGNTNYFGVNEHQVESFLKATFGTDKDISDVRRNFYIDSALTATLIPAGRIVKSLARMGSSGKAAESTSTVLQTGETAGTGYAATAEAVEDAIPLAVGRPSTNGVAAEVDAALSANEKAMSEVRKAGAGLERLSPEEQAKAVEARRKELMDFNKREQINSGAVRLDGETGTYQVDFFIGKKDGLGYPSEAHAKGAMTRSGITGEVVQTPTGYMIKQTHVLQESLMDSGLVAPPVGIIKRILQAPKAYIDSLLSRHGTAASYQNARTTQVIKEIYRKNIESLPKAQRKEIDEILDDMLDNDTREWLSIEELELEFSRRYQKAMTNGQKIAYGTYVQLSDFAHSMDNLAIYRDKAARGLQSLRINGIGFGEEFEGTVIRELGKRKIPDAPRVFNADTGSVVRMPRSQIEEMLNKGYSLVIPENTEWTLRAFNNEGAQMLLVKPKQVSVSPLSRSQLPYVAGGRREVAAPFYIGQTRHGRFADGTRYLKNPNILRAANTKEEVDTWIKNASLVSEKLLAVSTGKMTIQEFDDLVVATTGRDYTYWAKTAADEEWQLGEKFVVKKDRADFPVDVEDFEARDMMRMYNPESLESQFGVRKAGRLSSRGEGLKNVHEEDAAIYSFTGAMTRNIDRAINAGVWSDFKITSINRFNTQFRAFIENAENLSPFEIVTKGKVMDNVPKEIANQIKAHQFYINSLLRQRGKWDEMVASGMDKLANWIEKIPGTASKKISTNIYKNGGNPFEIIRSINFNFNLGLFNPRQFLTQANSVLVGVALSPRHGLAAAKDYAVLRYALISGDEGVAKHLAARTGELLGGTDVYRAAEQFKRIGLNSYGGNLAMMDAQSTIGATSNRFMSKTKRTLEHGRIFFEEGERMSRLTAYGIARRKFKDMHKDVDEYSKAADSWIREEADRLLLSPNADNNALIHKGIGAIPTQFWSYMMKLSDVMFTGSGGRYTAAERSRLAAAQVLFYGASGMPLLDMMLESAQTGGDPIDPTVNKALHNGLIDTIMFVASGGEANTNFAGANGVGGFWTKLARDMSEAPAVAILAGPAGANMHGAWRVMQNTMAVQSALQNPVHEQVTETALAGVVALVKSMSATSQAIMAYNTGVWQDKYGRSVANISKSEAILSLLGFYPQRENDVWKAAILNKNDREAFVDEVAKTHDQLLRRYYSAETEEERAHIQSAINAFSAISSQNGYAVDVADKVMQLQRSPSMEEAIMRNMQMDYFSGKATHPNLFTPEYIEQIMAEKNGN